MVARADEVETGVLTWPQIEAEYPSQWVALADPTTDEAGNITAGRVVWHGDNLDQGHARIRRMRLRRWSVLSTSPPSKGTKFLL